MVNLSYNGGLCFFIVALDCNGILICIGAWDWIGILICIVAWDWIRIRVPVTDRSSFGSLSITIGKALMMHRYFFPGKCYMNY